MIHILQTDIDYNHISFELDGTFAIFSNRTKLSIIVDIQVD
jgi:hypothetical protein